MKLDAIIEELTENGDVSIYQANPYFIKIRDYEAERVL